MRLKELEKIKKLLLICKNKYNDKVFNLDLDISILAIEQEIATIKKKNRKVAKHYFEKMQLKKLKS